MQVVAYLTESCLGCLDIKAASLSFGADAVSRRVHRRRRPVRIEEYWVN